MLIGFFEIEPNTQKLVLESNLECVGAVESLISHVRDKYGIKEEYCNDIWVVLNEAVSNAIRHGNKLNLSKKVCLMVECKNDTYVCFTVKDEGKGFDYKNLPDPTNPERIGEPDGRGVFLIQKLAHKVNFSKKGSVVEMCFDIRKSQSVPNK